MRADLPGAADRVGQVEFELGRVEGALAGQFFPAELGRRAAGGGDRVAKHLLGAIPFLIAAVPLLRAQRELDRICVEAEVAIDAVEKVAEGLDLVDQLVLAERRYGRRPG